jgi:hypothetical protein
MAKVYGSVVEVIEQNVYVVLDVLNASIAGDTCKPSPAVGSCINSSGSLTLLKQSDRIFFAALIEWSSY